MPVLPNSRHERFAQEIAKGRSASEAYVLAGYKPHDGNASTLRGNQKVLERLAEIQTRAAKRTEITIETLTAELEEARVLAMKKGQTAAAVAATMGKAKLHGKIVDKKHHSGSIGTYDLSKVPDDELDTLESILGSFADAGGDPSGEDQAE
jgi:hypothetical protein